MSALTPHWYAIYTKPRWEKKVHALLTEKKIESYCPLNKVRKKWSDRMKTVEEPLFKSYVFARVSEEEQTRVRMTAGVMNFVYWQGKPAIIRAKEIETIRKFLNDSLHPSKYVKPLNVIKLANIRFTGFDWLTQTYFIESHFLNQKSHSHCTKYACFYKYTWIFNPN